MKEVLWIFYKIFILNFKDIPTDRLSNDCLKPSKLMKLIPNNLIKRYTIFKIK